MKNKIKVLMLGAVILSITTVAKSAVTTTSTVIVGNDALRVTQLEVLNASTAAGAPNLEINPGGININSKWSFLLESDEDIVKINSITALLTGPTGATTTVNVSGSVYNVVTSAGSPTIGVYDANTNISSVNGSIISGLILPSGANKLVLADLTVPAGFSSGAYNPTTIGQMLSVKFTITGENTAGLFTSESTSNISVVPEPSSALMSGLLITSSVFLRRRRS